jgi:Sec-independent protein translocase protein TatA
MSWQEKLEASGINESNMPNMIKKAVNDLKAFQKEADKITNLLERDDLSDNKREQLEEDYDTLVASIENQEEVVEKQSWLRCKGRKTSGCTFGKATSKSRRASTIDPSNSRKYHTTNPTPSTTTRTY